MSVFGTFVWTGVRYLTQYIGNLLTEFFPDLARDF
jgi:hypothetical protein